MGVSMDLFERDFERDIDRLLAGLGDIAAPFGMARQLMQDLLLMQRSHRWVDGGLRGVGRVGWRRGRKDRWFS